MAGLPEAETVILVAVALDSGGVYSSILGMLLLIMLFSVITARLAEMPMGAAVKAAVVLVAMASTLVAVVYLPVVLVVTMAVMVATVTMAAVTVASVTGVMMAVVMAALAAAVALMITV